MNFNKRSSRTVVDYSFYLLFNFYSIAQLFVISFDYQFAEFVREIFIVLFFRFFPHRQTSTLCIFYDFRHFRLYLIGKIFASNLFRSFSDTPYLMIFFLFIRTALLFGGKKVK